MSSVFTYIDPRQATVQTQLVRVQRKQLQKTYLMTWLTQFRSEYVNFCLQVANVYEDSTNEELYELQKIGLTIRFMLSTKNIKQKDLRDALEKFWIFIKAQNYSEKQFQEELFILHHFVENVIESVEDQL